MHPYNSVLMIAALAMFGAAPARSQSEDFPSRIDSATILPVQPQEGDKTIMKHLRENGARLDEATSPVYVVKIYFNEPPIADAEGFTLLFGEQPIEEYGSFSMGVFFKVYDIEGARKLKGKEIRLIRRKSLIKTAVPGPDIDKLLFERSVKPGRYDAKGNRIHPSLAEALEN